MSDAHPAIERMSFFELQRELRAISGTPSQGPEDIERRAALWRALDEATGQSKSPPPPFDQRSTGHVCDDCGDHATLGVGVSLRTGQTGRWYCARCLEANEVNQ
jgi:hypothetical protein